jgi:hypothetical protein
MHTMNPAELERIRSVTSNYFFWQGLRWVPLGVVIMALGLKDTSWWPFAEAWEDVFIVTLVALVIAVSPLIGRYYRRTFGHVIDDLDAHQRRENTKWFLVYPLMISSLVIDMVFKPAFFVTGPVWSGGILAYWWSTGRGRPHYVIASLCMLVLGPIQWLGFVEPGKQMFSVFGLVLGAIYIVGGMLDHRELCRILKPVKES